MYDSTSSRSDRFCLKSPRSLTADLTIALPAWVHFSFFFIISSLFFRHTPPIFPRDLFPKWALSSHATSYGVSGTHSPPRFNRYYRLQSYSRDSHPIQAIAKRSLGSPVVRVGQSRTLGTVRLNLVLLWDMGNSAHDNNRSLRRVGLFDGDCQQNDWHWRALTYNSFHRVPAHPIQTPVDSYQDGCWGFSILWLCFLLVKH